MHARPRNPPTQQTIPRHSCLQTVAVQLTTAKLLPTVPFMFRERSDVCMKQLTVPLRHRHVIRSLSAYTYGARQRATQPTAPKKNKSVTHPHSPNLIEHPSFLA